jgi:predicted MFS family arabinose efflux permease
MRSRPSERKLLFLVGAVQFVNVLDFMMVMPLGPDFAASLDIPNSHLGYIGGSYTAAAAVAGMLGSMFLDRFDRRSALGVAMLGLVLGTLAGGFATGLHSLMAARIVAGAFGGPAHSLSLSIVVDVVPPERRGRALGAVLSVFSIAAVLGVPAGLELARHGGWRLPFFAVAGLGLLVAASAILLMPSLRLHLTPEARREQASVTGPFFGRPAVFLALLSMATVTMAAFAIVPNLSAYFQFNLGYPRDRLWLLYLVGGVFGFVAARWAGGLSDRFGAPLVSLGGTLLLGAVLAWGFAVQTPVLPPLLLFVAFMVTNTFRNISLNTLSSKVPFAGERARFMSSQSAVQHLSAAAGAFLSARILSELPGGRLAGMNRVALVSIGLAALLPLLLSLLEARLRHRELGPVRVEPEVADEPAAV